MKIFKVYLLVFTLISLPFFTQAQDDFEHLLKGRKIKFSIFVGPLFELSSVHNNFGFSTGGGGGLILNQTLFIGGYGLKLAPVIGTDVTLNNVNYDNLEIAFNHGGLWFGYIHNYKKLVHFGASTKLGWGNITLNDHRLASPYEDNVMVFTPQVEAEVNIMKWFKVNVGLGYRIVSGVNESVLNKKDFNSPQVTVGFLFGWFRQRN
ncbi:MAG: hypothetical protein M3512_16395 [Bacteroidota bacterium]|nr:hypothetical protein [Bacteroidota bacterium]